MKDADPSLDLQIPLMKDAANREKQVEQHQERQKTDHQGQFLNSLARIEG
jgi:hypothetical protein